MFLVSLHKQGFKCFLQEELFISDTFSDNAKDVSNDKKGVHCNQDQRRMSLMTSIVGVQPPSSSDTSTMRTIDLGHGSDLIYIQRFLPFQQSWSFFDYLHKHIPWTRPTIRVFGRSCLQPRDTCYVASTGLTALLYSGYHFIVVSPLHVPHAHIGHDERYMCVEEMDQISSSYVPKCLLSSLKFVDFEFLIQGYALELKLGKYFVLNEFSSPQEDIKSSKNSS